jgi:hypothetical protein
MPGTAPANGKVFIDKLETLPISGMAGVTFTLLAISSTVYPDLHTPAGAAFNHIARCTRCSTHSSSLGLT